jgi:hypothetical protein
MKGQEEYYTKSRGGSSGNTGKSSGGTKMGNSRGGGMGKHHAANHSSVPSPFAGSKHGTTRMEAHRGRG